MDRGTQAAAALGIATLAGLAAVPFVLGQYGLFVAAQMVALLYIAASLELSYTFGRVLSFCTGTFFAIGAYTAFYVGRHASSELAVMGLAAMAAGGICGLLTAALVVRMRGAHTAVIATLAVGSIAYEVADAMSGYTGGEDGLSLRQGLTVLGLGTSVGVSTATYYAALLPLAAYVLTFAAIRQTPFGTVMRAVGENAVRSEQLGFNVGLRRFVVLGCAAALSGLGGAMYCVLVGHISTALFQPILSLNGVLWATVGGLGSTFGAVIGTAIIYPATELASGVTRYVDALVGGLLILAALAFPKGITGALHRLSRHGRIRPAVAPQPKSNTTGAPHDQAV